MFCENDFKKGFTLIEISVYVLILGIVLIVIIALINPFEKITRGRDSARKNAVGQLANSMVRYYTLRASYPPIAGFLTTLKNSGEIKQELPFISYNSINPCQHQSQNGYCYNTDGQRALVFARLESSIENKRCNPFPGTKAYFLWASEDNKAGTVCFAPAAEGAISMLLDRGSFTYID